MEMDWKTFLSKAVREGNHVQTVQGVQETMAAGIAPADILESGLIPGIQALGELFKDGQVFLPEVLISVRAMNLGLEELKPHLIDVDIPKKGTVVLGTVEGDLHDIGKNLVRMMLTGNGYYVIDIGVDANAERFIETAQKHNADIVAMSGLLTTAMPYFETIVEALQQAGLRSQVKVMIGGAPVTRAYADEIAVEGFADDCVTAVDEAHRLMMSK